jgi:predicted nucleotidyltransferase
MNFLKVIERITTQFDEENIRYALIGGFAMALRGVQRATIDLDFILMLEDLDAAEAIFMQAGYQRAFRSDNVSHYISEDNELGRIDILHVFRGPTLSMLERADRIETSPDASLPVVQIEDIIGLKIQASVNNPKRVTRDYADIRMILENAAEIEQPIDWELLEDYLNLFKLGEKLTELKSWYGTTD